MPCPTPRHAPLPAAAHSSGKARPLRSPCPLLPPRSPPAARPRPQLLLSRRSRQGDGASAVAEKADEMDAHAREGHQGVPGEDRGQGQPACWSRAWTSGVKVYELTATRDAVGGRAGQSVQAMDVQRPGARPADSREGRRPRARRAQERAARVDGRSTSTASSCRTTRTACRSSRSRRSSRASRTRTSSPCRTRARTCTTRTTTRPSRSAWGCSARSSWSRSSRARSSRWTWTTSMILNDGQHGYTLNGKGFPATEPIVAKLGQKVRIRFMNEGMMIHPMHLHGMHMTVIDKDGWPQPAPWKCDTLNIAPGRALGRDRELQQSRDLGLPLPHPAARRVRARDVRHGDGAGGEAGHRLRERNAEDWMNTAHLHLILNHLPVLGAPGCGAGLRPRAQAARGHPDRAMVYRRARHRDDSGLSHRRACGGAGGNTPDLRPRPGRAPRGGRALGDHVARGQRGAGGLGAVVVATAWSRAAHHDPACAGRSRGRGPGDDGHRLDRRANRASRDPARRAGASRFPGCPIHSAFFCGDTIDFTLVNGAKMPHAMDFHAAEIAPDSATGTSCRNDQRGVQVRGAGAGRLHVPLRHRAGRDPHRQRDVRRPHRRSANASTARRGVRPGAERVLYGIAPARSAIDPHHRLGEAA